ncbi:cell division cycle-associated protein 3 [Eucyclogobius newberryi]|uniref:cell division cycle-associated protein 3 n=1 Tax=Eucyclogobius newberryi TaxID=166745 RepID=UPI003B5AC2F4
MGSSESKLSAAPSEIKPELPFKAARVNELLDPRSPSGGIDRTPIQVGDASRSSAQVKRACPVTELDPRSPSVGITRTPAREVMRATVGSFARRFGMLFHNDAENKTHQSDVRAEAAEEEEDSKPEEISSSEPLLTPPSHTLRSLDTHAAMLDTPRPPPDQSAVSPFVLLQEYGVELETEADFSLDEAEEARETPIHKRLSLSLIACHDVSISASQICDDGVSDASEQPLEQDHAYAIPSVTIQSPVERSVPDDVKVNDANTASETSCEPEVVASGLTEKTKEVEETVTAPTTSQESTESRPCAPSPRPHHIRCPTIDAKSPSQIVFKPQWLGKGFGGAGQRVRAQAAKGGRSPLALHVVVKNVANDENKGQSGKAKSKGNDGRSPLQALKETNSPRSHRAQMKLKAATPERRRSAHAERRVLAVAVDKENR